jgi:negative regulator of flagellin synthesis FlgM
MKVTQQPLPNTQALEPSRNTEKNPATTGKPASSASPQAVQGSSVEISDNARMMKQAADIARHTPDVRQDRVAALKQAIAAGQYQIHSEKIADRLIDEHLNTDFGKNNL